MKGKSFETFHVAQGNQEAYTVCRRIALLEEMGPALIVLLGPEGCGKSHLLWAIAKQVRAGTLPAGLALIAAGEIPDKVRALVEDFRPLQGRRAMLLIDGLEHFQPESAQLDALIEIFLACQHPVVVSTNVHPNRLTGLTVPLANRLAGGRLITMEAQVRDGDEAATERIQALEETARELQRQRDALHEQLVAASEATAEARRAAQGAEASATALKQDSETAASQLTTLQLTLDAAQAGKATAEARVTALEREVEKVRGDLTAAVGRIRQAESEADFALAQQARLQGALAAARMEAEETGPLRESLATAERCVAAAVEGLARMAQEHAAACGVMTAEAASVAEDMDAAVAAQAGVAGREAALKRALAEAQTAQQQVQDSLAATRERLKAVEFEWAKSRKAMAIQTAEMDALRNAAASQAAQASIQTGELEQRLHALENSLDSLRATRPSEGDTGPGKVAWSMALEQMQAQLAALRETRAAAPAEGPHDDQAVFEADFFEALPENFDGPGNLPGLDDELKDALGDALVGPDMEKPLEHKEAPVDSPE